MQGSHPSLSQQQTAIPPPVPDISADWVFGITPNTAYVSQLPSAAHSRRQEHSTSPSPQCSASTAEGAQLESGHHSQPDAVTARPVSSAQAGQREALLAASLVSKAPSVSLAASSVAPSASLAASSVTAASAVKPAAADSAMTQSVSLAASIVTDSISAQPADAVPASVREAVDRFESWTLAQAAVVLPPCLADAPATQANLLLAHSQQTMQPALHKHVPSAQAQQRPLHLQQQHQGLPGETVFQPQQAVTPQHESAASQSSEYTPALPVSVFTGADARRGLQGSAAGYLQREGLPPILSQARRELLVSIQAQASCMQPVPVPQQPQSSALTVIEATLAAINADQPVATQEPSGPLPCDNGLTTRLANSTAVLAPQATSCQADRQAGAAASSSVAEPLGPLEGCMQRPPLPGKRAGQGFLNRPRFADAFANPSLYQQPWLQGAALSAHADAVPRSQAGGVSHAQEGGNSSGPSLHGCHATAEGRAASSGHTSCADTTAVAGAAQHHLTRDTGSQCRADSHSTTLSLASRSPTQSLAGDTTCPLVLDHGRTAGTSVSRDATQLSDREDNQGGDDGEVGRKGSRWSAVNAYRQAREAAVRTASGTGPAAVRVPAGTGPARMAPALCATVPAG